MMTEPVVFCPQYERKFKWSIIGVVVMIIPGIPMSLASGDVWLVVSVAFLALMLMVMPFVIIKEID